jgi:dihydroxyacetone kinase-like protein
MNFDMAAELAVEEGIEVRTVLIYDDVASAAPSEKNKRRGIAGLVPIVKLAGAAAVRARSLEELERLATKARDNTRSIGVSTLAGSIPANGKPTFELAPGMMGLGMGIHGEKGVATIAFCGADELAHKLLELILKDDLAFEPGCEVVLLVNSLGSTTMMELLIVLRALKPLLRAQNIQVRETLLGPYVTCQEMAGLSISLVKLDEELKRLWEMPCSSVCYTKM